MRAVEPGVRLARVAHPGDRVIRVGLRRRPTGVVHHMPDASGTVRGIEEDGQQIAEAAWRKRGRDLEGVISKDVDSLVEEAVAPHAVALEAGHLGSNLEGGPAVDPGCLHPGSLVGDVVWHLVL